MKNVTVALVGSLASFHFGSEQGGGGRYKSHPVHVKSFNNGHTPVTILIVIVLLGLTDQKLRNKRNLCYVQYILKFQTLDLTNGHNLVQ